MGTVFDTITKGTSSKTSTQKSITKPKAEDVFKIITGKEYGSKIDNRLPFKNYNDINDRITPEQNLVTLDYSRGKDYKESGYADDNVFERIGATAADVGDKLATGFVRGFNNTGILIGKVMNFLRPQELKKMENSKSYVPKSAGDQLKENTAYLETKIKEHEQDMETSILNAASYMKKDSKILGVNVEGALESTGDMIYNIMLGNLLGGATKAPQLIDKTIPLGKRMLTFAKTAMKQPSNYTMFADVYGGAYMNAKDNGATEDEASLYSLLEASKEVVTENIAGGIGGITGKGPLDEMAEALIRSKIKNKILQEGFSVGATVFGEGVEEVTSALLEPFIQQVYSKKLDFSSYKNLFNDFMGGVLVSGLMLGGQASIKNYAEMSKSEKKKAIETTINEKAKESLVTEIKEAYNSGTPIDDITLAMQVNTGLDNDTIKEIILKVNPSIDVTAIDNLIKKNETITTTLNTLMNVDQKIDSLVEQLTQITPTSKIDINGIYGELESLRKQKEELIKELPIEEQVDKITEMQEENNKNIDLGEEVNAQEIIDSNNKTIEEVISTLENEKDITPMSNNQYISKNNKLFDEQAKTIVDHINMVTQREGNDEVKIINKLNTEQKELVTFAAIFKKKLVFVRNLKANGLVETQHPDIILMDIDTQLPTVWTKGKANKSLFVLGHEIFHSLKGTNAKVYTDFVDFISSNVTNEQILKFMTVYDPQDAQGFLRNLQIDGDIDVAKILKDKSKYQTQYDALSNISEEMIANEFGAMMNDKDFLLQIKEKNPTLFERIVDAIKKIFDDLIGTTYDSPLTKLQIKVLRENFVKTIDLATQEQKQEQIKETKKEVVKEEVKVTKPEVVKEVKKVETIKEEPKKIPDYVKTEEDKKIYESILRQEEKYQKTKEVKKVEKKVKEEVKPKLAINPDVKVSTINLSDRFAFINKNYDRYVSETNKDKKKLILDTTLKSYENYKKDGGTEINENLENLQKQGFKTQLGEKLNLKLSPKVVDKEMSDFSKEDNVTKTKEIESGSSFILEDGTILHMPANPGHKMAEKTYDKPLIDIIKETGAVRIGDYTFKNGKSSLRIEILNKPTDFQLDKIDNYLSKNNFDSISLELNGEFKQYTNSKYLTSDIGTYYKTGKFPVRSEFRMLPKNELSKEQETYFKDSKVRDKDGNLLKVYHVSDANFNEFKGSNILSIKDGIVKQESNGMSYFTANNKYIAGIKNHLEKNRMFKFDYNSFDENGNFTNNKKNITKYSVYLDIRNPLDLSDIKSNLTIKEWINVLKDKGIILTPEQITEFSLYNLEREPKMINYNTDFQSLIKTANKDFVKLLTDAGYDGIILDDRLTEAGVNHSITYITINPNQIKNVDNLNPTTSPDIRYLPKAQKESKFYTNTLSNNELYADVLEYAKSNNDLKMYTTTSHDADMNAAMEMIKKDGPNAITNFYRKDNLNTVDNALGLIMMKYYRAKGDINSETAVLTKIRESGTKSAQYVESLKIFKDASPAAIVVSIQNDFDKAFAELKDSRDPTVKTWLRENSDKLALTPAEREWIYQMADKASKYSTDSKEYNQIYGLINKFVADKIPKTIATKVKAFRRIAMLFNPKTIVRNYLGNKLMEAPNVASDTFGSVLDRQLSKISGVRTQGTIDLKTYSLAKKEGMKNAIEDYKLGIGNSIINNPFEATTGNIWKDKGAGKVLNWFDKQTNMLLDVGDRGFYNAYYENSLKNQMRLNNVTEATESMKEIARAEAEKKTWKNNGKLAVLAKNTRQLLNSYVGFKNGTIVTGEKGTVDFGLGDLILPFILTPANLAVATYDYSPLAIMSVAKNAKAFSDAVKSGKNVAIAQKAFVDSFGKAVTGTILYAIGYALAKSGLITGGEDEDKDIRAVLKAQGFQPFSIKIGDKTFAYDWAQPVASPFAVMAELDRIKKNDNITGDKKDALYYISQALTIGGNRLVEQSFFQSLNSILSAQTPQEGLIDFGVGVPQSFVPTLLKQFADIIDGNTKVTYDKNNLLTTMLMKVMSKVPGVKSLLPNQKNIIGKDVKQYGGNNNFFNVFLNPANVSQDNMGIIGDEIMDVYNHTGEKGVMPQVVITYYDYDINGDGNKERINFSTKQQSDLQSRMGEITQTAMDEILNSDVYNNASYENKATALISLMQYSKSKALEESGYVNGYTIKSGNASQINNYIQEGLSVSNAVMYDSIINPIESLKDEAGETIQGSLNGQKAYTIMNLMTSDDMKNTMLRLISPTAKTPETVDSLSNLSTQQQYIDYYSLPRRDVFVLDNFSRDDYDIGTTYFNINGNDYMTYTSGLSELKSDIDSEGNTIEGSKKRKVISYINSLPINQYQKVFLYKTSGYSIKSYKSQMFNYINSMELTVDEKKSLWTSLGY